MGAITLERVLIIRENSFKDTRMNKCIQSRTTKENSAKAEMSTNMFGINTPDMAQNSNTTLKFNHYFRK